MRALSNRRGTFCACWVDAVYVAVPSWLDCCLCVPDGVDGKQARRTNSSTPLGELFDHGLDSWACIFFVATVYSIFGRGVTGVDVTALYYILWVVLFSFILSHWEKYNTGILFLPWGYDVSQVVSQSQCALHTQLVSRRWKAQVCSHRAFSLPVPFLSPNSTEPKM